MTAWYSGDSTYDTILTAALAFAALVAVSAPLVASPYGKFASGKFGVALDPRLGWLLMELPSPVVFLIFFLQGPHRFDLVPLLFMAVWLLHYGNRTFFFPLSIRTPKGGKASFSFFVIAMGWIVTPLHGYLNGAWFSTFGHYSTAWLTDPRFLVGFPIYLASLASNIHCDAIIRNLRTRDEIDSGAKVYRIPEGGLFRLVTCASYLTELTAWMGFAIFTWSLAGAFIFAVSAANLVPRAFATHRWYRERFPDYPRARKALIPFVL
jgi:3-oxo-5-alpha-steroid 4-dehydrogenase 1